MNDSQFISALVPTPLREELSRSARLHDRSLSAEIRTALRQHLGVEDPGYEDQRSSPLNVDSEGATGGVAPSAALGDDA